MVWQAIGYYMVMYMSSMGAVPGSTYEAADLDGANRVQQFFQVTLPLIWTNIRTTLTFFIISTINMAFLFVNAMVGSSGGVADASKVTLIYMFDMKNQGLYGYSMAAGVVIFLVSFALSALVNKFTEREVLEY
jgi:N-acetylglucosamine transport system permease protein